MDTKEGAMEVPVVSSNSPSSHSRHQSGSTRHAFVYNPSLTAAPQPDIEVEIVEAMMASDPNARPNNFRSTFEECVFVFTVMMCSSATTFLQGVTIINTATIGKDLKMTTAQITWISASLGLSSGSFVLFFGKTADLVGKKAQLIFGLVFMSIFALMTAFAPNGMALNILLGFLGLGTAAIAPPSVGILFATYSPGRRRNKATGALGCGNPLGFVVGSISSALATRYSTWRASFIVVAVFFALMTAMVIWVVPIIPRAGNLRLTLRQFDYLGTILTVMGMALLSAGLTEGPASGWTGPKVVAMLVLGVGLLFGFVIWENIYSHPLLDPTIWRVRNFNLCILCVFFGYMSFITSLFWISLYMQDVQMLSPLLISARLLPQTIGGVICSFLGQWLVSRISGTSIMGMGAAAYVVGAVLLMFNRQNTSYWLFLFPSISISVMGADFQFIVANLYINTQMQNQASLGAGVLQTAMRLSISLGLAVTAAVYGTASNSPQGHDDVNVPYERAFVCCILFSAVGFLSILFMRIGVQGGALSPEKVDKLLQDRPQTDGQYSDRTSRDYDGRIHDLEDRQSGRECGSSTLTVNTMATTGSQQSYFPRWSWEQERLWNEDRGSKVVYEVCIKCLEERRVVVQDTEDWQKRNQLPIQQHSEFSEAADHSRYNMLTDEQRYDVQDEENGYAMPQQRHYSRPTIEHNIYNRILDERKDPRVRSARAWERFPVKPTIREKRGDVSIGGDGWL